MPVIYNTKKNEDNDPSVLLTKIQLPTLYTTKYREKEVELDMLDPDSLQKPVVNALAIAGTGQNNANLAGIFENRDSDSSIKIGDNEIKTMYPETRGRRGKLSKRGAKATASKILGLNGITQIPLPHSGFWITIDVIPRVNRLVLEQQLAQHELEIAIDTATLIYSAPRAIYVSMLMDFISEFIIDTSLSIPEDEDILDHISILDIDVLVLEIVKVFQPNGFEITLGCENVFEVNGDTTKCNYTITGKVDLKEVYRYDKDYVFSDEQKELLTKRQSGSVSKEDAKHYRTVYSNTPNNKKYEFDINGKSLIIELEICTIREYLDITSKFKVRIEELVDDILTGEENPNVRIAKINEISKDVILVNYVHFIKSISVDGDVTTDKSVIYDTMVVFMDDPSLVTNIITKIIEFIDSNIIAMVCTPSYICPNCRKVTPPSDIEDRSPFNDMVPLDILNVFTDLRIKS